MSHPIQIGDTKIDITSVTNSVAIYNVTVDVVRNAIVVGALGNAKTPSTIVTNMLCDIRWLSMKEKNFFKKKTPFIDAILHCRIPAGVTIVESDVISYNGKQYEIIGVENVRNLNVLLKIGLRKVD